MKVDVDFVDGEVTTTLYHERSGHTQLARMVDSHNHLEMILKNPRIHTGIGYHVGTQVMSPQSLLFHVFANLTFGE